MKILHLLQSDRFSGAENVVCQIISLFGNEKDIQMVYSSRDGQIREALAERNVIFFPIKDLNTKEVKRVINEVKPDIIHAHDMRASFVASIACGKIPLVSHIHNNNFDSRGLSVKSIAYLIAAVKAKHIFWVSNSSYKGYFFHNLFKKKSSVLYNIISIDALYDRMNKDTESYNYDACYVGRLTYPKNPQRLMAVLKKVADSLPDVKAAVVGTGDLEEETKKACAELGLQNNVEFLGFNSNPLKILHDSKVMVMTSRWEGTPMCALEALSLGVPIVSTPTDGLCDLISDDENGFLSDDDTVLAEKIVSIIENGELHRKLNNNAKKNIREYMDSGTYKSKIINIYNNTKGDGK